VHVPKDEVTLLAAKYPNEEHAKTTLDMLEQMHRALTITMKDAAMITRDDDGKVKVHEIHEVTTKKGAVRGGIVTGILGVIYPPSLIASVLAGVGLGGIWGRIRDTGIKTDKIKELADSLQPGQAAVIALVSQDTAMATQRALKGYEGDLVTEVFDEKALKQEFIDETQA
jgi:uncharacterized membrane protein